jgi:hypothetical protein
VVDLRASGQIRINTSSTKPEMDFQDKLHMIGWGVAFSIVAVLVVSVIRDQKKRNG